jgi:Domain of unknown function (DUF5666)
MSMNEPMGTHEHEGSAPSPAAEEILSRPIPTRGLDRALAERPRRRGMPTSTGVLVAIILLAATFVGGLIVGRQTAPDQGSVAAGRFPGYLTAPSGAPAAGSAGGGFAVGTVARVDGDTLYLRTAQGDTVKVQTDGDTQVRVSQDATLGDLETGSTVIVQGSTNDAGTLEASRISEGDLGIGGGFGQGGPPGGSHGGTSSG